MHRHMPEIQCRRTNVPSDSAPRTLTACMHQPPGNVPFANSSWATDGAVWLPREMHGGDLCVDWGQENRSRVPGDQWTVHSKRPTKTTAAIAHAWPSFIRTNLSPYF